LRAGVVKQRIGKAAVLKRIAKEEKEKEIV
jgi:hypothetical protein